VMVTNLQNDTSLELIITDRGPFAKGRILDLSYAAGRALGAIGPGTIPVRLEVIDGPEKVLSIRSSLDYTLQMGSFSQLENAQQLRDRLARIYRDVNISLLEGGNGRYYRVQLGTFSSRDQAEDQARQLAQAGFPVVIMEK